MTHAEAIKTARDIAHAIINGDETAAIALLQGLHQPSTEPISFAIKVTKRQFWDAYYSSQPAKLPEIGPRFTPCVIHGEFGYTPAPTTFPPCSLCGRTPTDFSLTTRLGIHYCVPCYYPDLGALVHPET